VLPSRNFWGNQLEIYRVQARGSIWWDMVFPNDIACHAGGMVPVDPVDTECGSRRVNYKIISCFPEYFSMNSVEIPTRKTHAMRPPSIACAWLLTADPSPFNNVDWSASL
jgi:hypothetical protein